MSIGASYNFGVAKVVAGSANQVQACWFQRQVQQLPAGRVRSRGWRGRSEGSVRLLRPKGDAKAHQLSLGYVHNLSKRTALYGTVAYLKNKTVPPGPASQGCERGWLTALATTRLACKLVSATLSNQLLV
jgi:predicted porin